MIAATQFVTDWIKKDIQQAQAELTLQLAYEAVQKSSNTGQLYTSGTNLCLFDTTSYGLNCCYVIVLLGTIVTEPILSKNLQTQGLQ